MTIETEIYDLQEAKERIGDLLIKINREGGYGKGLTYLFTPFTFLKVADSFTETGETPVTPFDIPRKQGEDLYYSVMGFDEEEAKGKAGLEYKGAVGYIEKCPPLKGYLKYPELSRGANDGKPYYKIVALSPEEVDPLNFILPFRNIPLDKLFIFAFARVRFYKPVRTLSIEEALTPEGQGVIRKYLDREDYPYWNYDEVEEKRYIDRTLSKEDLFYVEDDEAEENPDLFPDTYRSNIILTESPSPSLLSRATGKRVDSARAYASAIEKIVGTPLDERERGAAIRTYHFNTTDLFLAYALYEFSRTEDYSHLTKILSNYSDFGLSPKWEKDCIFLREWKGGKQVRLSPEEYVLSKYLQHHYSTMVASPSFRELSQATGTPIGIITKAAQFRIWD